MTAVDIAPTPAPEKHPALGPFYDVREMVLAAVLAALAGATGAAAWLYSSGWYVTFMTGNSERMVLEHLKSNHTMAFAALGTVVVFVLGVIVATLARVFVWQKARHGATVLTAMATAVAWLCDLALDSRGAEIGALPVLCLAFGLGALNTSISRRGEVVMPLSYVTGTLVKIGQGTALHLSGVKRWGWVPHTTTYAGFLAGAGLGGALFTAIGVHNSLLALMVVALATAAVTWRLDHPAFMARDVN